MEKVKNRAGRHAASPPDPQGSAVALCPTAPCGAPKNVPLCPEIVWEQGVRDRALSPLSSPLRWVWLSFVSRIRGKGKQGEGKRRKL